VHGEARFTNRRVWGAMVASSAQICKYLMKQACVLCLVLLALSSTSGEALSIIEIVDESGDGAANLLDTDPWPNRRSDSRELRSPPRDRGALLKLT